MKMSKIGVWYITEGECDECYLLCDATGKKIKHPENIATHNGLLMNTSKELQDLAMAIFQFEKKKGRGNELLKKLVEAEK